MKVGLIYAGEQQVALSCRAAEGATVEDVIQSSGILKICQDIDLTRHKVGIYGKYTKLDNKVKDGDRIEIYRKITRVLDDEDDDDDD